MSDKRQKGPEAAVQLYTTQKSVTKGYLLEAVQARSRDSPEMGRSPHLGSVHLQVSKLHLVVFAVLEDCLTQAG